MRGRGRQDDAPGHEAHGEGPDGAAPTPEWDEARPTGQGQQHPVALGRDETGEHHAHRRSDHGGVQVQSEGQQERHGEHARGARRIGERRRQLPESTRVLGQRGDVPQHAGQSRHGRDRRDDHHGQGDPPAVAVVQRLDHDEGSEETEERGTEREEGRGMVNENRADHPPHGQRADGQRDDRGRPVLEADQGHDGDDRRHDGHAERIGGVEATLAVHRGGQHADHEGGQRRGAARLALRRISGRSRRARRRS